MTHIPLYMNVEVVHARLLFLPGISEYCGNHDCPSLVENTVLIILVSFLHFSLKELQVTTIQLLFFSSKF